MKGIIFTELSRMVEQNYGMALWNEILDEVKPESQGIYVATVTYSDQELVDLLTYLSDKLKTPTTELLYQFGTYLFPIFAKKYSVFIPENGTLKEFLKSIDQIIHVEVLKLNPHASLPKILHEEPNAESLVLYYSSPRKLCHLALGLIKGASCYFKEKIDIRHPECMHQGAPQCRLEIDFS